MIEKQSRRRLVEAMVEMVVGRHRMQNAPADTAEPGEIGQGVGQVEEVLERPVVVDKVEPAMQVGGQGRLVHVEQMIRSLDN